MLYLRCYFPLTEIKFNDCIDQLLGLNPVSNTQQLQILVVVLGGVATAQGCADQVFINGFEGDIRDVVFIAQPMTLKPQWSFDHGINVMTYVHQRPNSQAKPTSYWGGLQGQWQLTYYNVFFLLGRYYDKMVSSLEIIRNNTIHLTLAERSRHLALAREVRANNVTFLNSYSFEDSDFDQLVQQWLADEQRVLLPELEARYMKDICHDVIFMSSDGYLLEGSTFSLLVLDANREWVVVPLESESGSILESITVSFIKKGLSFSSISYQSRCISMAELRSCLGMFAVSSTRLQFHNKYIALQPIRQCNGFGVGQTLVTALPEYQQLSQALLRYQQYYYSQSPVV